MSVPLSANGDGTWSSSGTITICGVTYTLTFNREGCDGPCLTLTTASGSPVTYTAVRDCCIANCAIFAIGDPRVCSGTAAAGGPVANAVRIQVCWNDCSVELVDCPYTPLSPNTKYVTFGGSWSSLGTVMLIWSAAANGWIAGSGGVWGPVGASGPFVVGGCSMNYLILGQAPGCNFQLTGQTGGLLATTGNLTVSSAVPFSATGTFAGTALGCNTYTGSVTVTD